MHDIPEVEIRSGKTSIEQIQWKRKGKMKYRALVRTMLGKKLLKNLTHQIMIKCPGLGQGQGQGQGQ